MLFTRIQLTFVLCLLAFSARSDTYFGVLTSPANTGPGGSCCSFVAKVDANSASVPSDGTCVGCSVITKAQFDAYETAANKPQTTVASVNSKIATGITLTCSTTPSLSGTYPVNSTVMTTLNTIVGWYVANGNAFPSGASAITVQDSNGALHTFPNIGSFASFYNAVAIYWLQLIDYQQRVIAGQTPTVPSATSTAC